MPSSASGTSPRRTRCSRIRSSRATYDRLGHAGLRRGGFEPSFSAFGDLSDVFAAFFGEDLFGGSAARAGPARGPDVQAVVDIELEEAFTGIAVTVPLEVAVACEHCGAKGAEPGTETRSCTTCGGAGMVRRVSRNVFGQFVHQRVCPECGGAGKVFETPCSACEGEGRTIARRQLDVDIPPGIHDGQRILIRGEGNAGYQGGTPGNVLVVVRVRPDPRFIRDGDDLRTTIRLTMTEAALGTTAFVAHSRRRGRARGSGGHPAGRGPASSSARGCPRSRARVAATSTSSWRSRCPRR